MEPVESDTQTSCPRTAWNGRGRDTEGMTSMLDQPTPSEALKTCPGCHEAKAPSEYYRDRRKPTGRCTRCKACHTARSKALWADPETRAESSAANSRWHRDNPEKNYERTRRWVANRGVEYRATRTAAGVPVAGTLQYHTERLIVLERDDGACGICGEDIDPQNYDLDHIVPTSRGGVHELDNLQLAHRACNSRKATSLEVAA